MRSLSETPVCLERLATGQLCVTQYLPSPEEELPWGVLTVTLENGVPTLHWSGVGPFQLQISYDLVEWHNEGSCMEGPADIAVTPRDQGGPQYFRVVPCQETPQ